MIAYSAFDIPSMVFGIAGFEKRKSFARLPDDVIAAVPSLEFLGRRSPGGRICFKTNSKRLLVKLEYETLTPDIGMSIYACQSAFVYRGARKDLKLLGLVTPKGYDTKVFEKEFTLSGQTEEITIILPRNEIIKSIDILIEDEASLLAPTPYKYSKPIIYYGSSITEGGCCCNPINCYNAIISRHLDVDYYNFGFSGSCKGESAMADYFNTLDFSIFVLDYDHNAPNVEHLRNTHEPFYKRIREANKNAPIIMLTRPRPYHIDDEAQRLNVVKQTYENARSNGDENVYFVDGRSFFEGFEDAEHCFIDGCHPNDLGFYKMAMGLEPLIKSLLEELK